jgi:hypothetical protein
MQSVYLQSVMKKNAAKGYEKTKPKQTQFLQRPKMNANIFITKDYENETALELPKNKPKQSQFLYQELHCSFIITCLYKKGRYINLLPIARES